MSPILYRSGTQTTPTVTLSGRSSRRQFMVRTAAAACAFTAPLAQAQGGNPRQRRLAVAQLADLSPASQDVSRDFLVGSRAAWQEINSSGGIRGQLIAHEVVETDHSVSSIDKAWLEAIASPDNLLCFGSVGNAVAQHLNRSKSAAQAQIAHIAPWLQNNSAELDSSTLPVFAHREEQLAHAIRAMSVAGMNYIAVAFASSELQTQTITDIRGMTSRLGIRLQEIEPQTNLQAMAAGLRGNTAPMIVFVGGTPELVQFASGMQRTGLQRYLVAMADVNLQTAQQMGISDNTPLIVTQTVPLATSGLGIVRRYRAALARYFDEPPTSHSLAGYIAAQSAARVLNSTEGKLTRANVLRTARSINRLDLDGFAVSYQDSRRTTGYVTQSMLGANGRVIG